MHLSICACAHIQRETDFKEPLSRRAVKSTLCRAGWQPGAEILLPLGTWVFFSTAFYLLDEAHPHYER